MTAGRRPSTRRSGRDGSRRRELHHGGRLCCAHLKRRSDGRHGPAVDHVLGADDRRRPVGHQEPGEVGDLRGACEPAERDAAEGVEDQLLGCVSGDVVAVGDAIDEPLVGLGLDASGLIALTRTPRGAGSFARPLLYVRSAAFAAA